MTPGGRKFLVSKKFEKLSRPIIMRLSVYYEYYGDAGWIPAVTCDLYLSNYYYYSFTLLLSLRKPKGVPYPITPTTSPSLGIFCCLWSLTPGGDTVSAAVSTKTFVCLVHRHTVGQPNANNGNAGNANANDEKEMKEKEEEEEEELARASILRKEEMGKVMEEERKKKRKKKKKKRREGGPYFLVGEEKKFETAAQAPVLAIFCDCGASVLQLIHLHLHLHLI